MKRILSFFLFFVILSTSLYGQWKKVLDLGTKAGGVGPMFAFHSKLFASTSLGAYLSEDTGRTWKVIDSSAAMMRPMQFISNDSMIFTNSVNGGIYISKDSGRTWQVTDSDLRVSFNTIAIVGGDLVGASVTGVYVSKDLGKHWVASNKGLPSKPPTRTSFLSGLFSFDGKLNIFFTPHSYLSYDHGASWHRKGDSCNCTDETIVVGHRLFASLSNRIYLSTDSSKTWKLNLEGVPPISTLERFYFSQNILLAGFEYGGVAVSKDSGSNWYYMNDGLPSTLVTSVCILGDYAFAGLRSGLIYKRPLQEITAASVIPETTGFQSRLYPNPVRHSAVIVFNRSLRNGQIIIYDISGRPLKQIDKIDTDIVRLDTDNLASGYYIYSITEQGKKLAGGQFEVAN